MSSEQTLRGEQTLGKTIPVPQIYPSARYLRYVVAVLLAVVTLAFTDRGLMALLVSSIKQDLALTDTQLSLLLGPAFLIPFGLGSILGGILSDRMNRRNLLLIGLVIWSAAAMFGGVSTSFGELAISRIGIGIGMAVVDPCVYSMVADYFPPERRGKATAIVASGLGAGTGIALFGGGLLLTLHGQLLNSPWPLLNHSSAWHFVFMTCGLAGIVVAVLLLTVREPAPMTQEEPRADDGLHIGSYIAAQFPTLIWVYLAYMLNILVLGAIGSWAPTVLVRSYGFSPAQSGYAVGIVMTVAMVAATLLGGVWGDVLAKRRDDGRFLIALITIPFYVPGMLLACLSPAPILALVGMTLAFLVGGATATTVYAALPEITPHPYRGRMIAVYGILANVIGVLIGVIAPAWVTDHVLHNPNQLNLSLVLVCVPATILSTLCCVLGLPRYRNLRVAILSGFDVHHALTPALRRGRIAERPAD